MTPKGHAIPSKTQLLSYGTPALQHLFLLFSNAYLYKVHLSPAIFKSGRPFETSLSRDGYCIYFAFVFPLQAQHFDNLRNPHSCKSNRPHPYQC